MSLQYMEKLKREKKREKGQFEGKDGKIREKTKRESFSFHCSSFSRYRKVISLLGGCDWTGRWIWGEIDNHIILFCLIIMKMLRSPVFPGTLSSLSLFCIIYNHRSFITWTWIYSTYSSCHRHTSLQFFRLLLIVFFLLIYPICAL